MIIVYIPIILGTAREGRYSDKAARFMLDEAKKYGLESEIIDVRDYVIKATDNTGKAPQSRKLSGRISKADGIIIVTPEYNHGYPGELKIVLDMLYGEYERKPVGICGVSVGGLGGARVVEQLRIVAVEFHMVPIREAMYFSSVRELFGEKGAIKDESYRRRAKAFFDELVWYAKALKAAREGKE